MKHVYGKKINRRNKQKLEYFKIFILFLILFSLMIPQNTYAKIDDEYQDDEVVRTINKINEIRDVYKLPLLSYNEDLNKTALIHNRYMKYNFAYSSIEEIGKLFYRGRYPWDRASYNGYLNSYVFELLGKNISTYMDGLTNLMQNPYARYGILDPLYTDLGMNTYEGYSTYLFGGVTRSRSYDLIYPYNKQVDVDTNFKNTYIIDPFNDISGTSDTKGIPITYSFYSSDAKVTDYKNVSVKLINTLNNEEIKVKIVTSLEDRNLTNTIMILPLEEYNLGTTYKIDFNAEVIFNHAISFNNETPSFVKEINYVGTFTTKTTTTETNQSKFVTREKFVEDLIKASSYELKDSLEIIFPDVNINAPNYKYIYTAYINNIVIGYSDGQYRPTANLTREQAYTIFIRNYEKQIGTISLTRDERKLQFIDTKTINSYALEAIYKAKKIGILIDSQYSFLPKTYITINEFQQIMERYQKALDL